ncbi:MAG: A/G-specific adenine glycosylase, partial [Alphaproteobacteria bacterium]|nr:A/G-specific adenine glycosylase [Alphaproteobacteria bacterium]
MARRLPTKTTKCQTALPLPDPAALLRWYDRHRRVLPWRALPGQVADPYAVWISEIMLQQTTVAAVIPYFQKFMRLWPTLQDLADAPLDAVLRQWAGLGYYRRARLLHQCAQVLRTEYDGKIPAQEQELIKLPGFGPYTAAAVAAIAFDEPATVVDGNVERVMARIFAVSQPLPQAKTELRQHAAALQPKCRHGDYAQALMDLGATVCAPRQPQCPICPWQSNCLA